MKIKNKLVAITILTSNIIFSFFELIASQQPLERDAHELRMQSWWARTQTEVAINIDHASYPRAYERIGFSPTFSHLHVAQLPLLFPLHHFWEINGVLYMTQQNPADITPSQSPLVLPRFQSDAVPTVVKLYDVQNGRINYAAKGGMISQAFAFTQDQSRETRPSFNFSYVLDGSYGEALQIGHKIDLVDGAGSARDPLNLGPQFKYFNEYLRKNFVMWMIREPFKRRVIPEGYYREVDIFPKSPQFVTQVNRSGTTMQTTYLPAGFLLSANAPIKTRVRSKTIYTPSSIMRHFFFPNFQRLHYDALPLPPDRRARYEKLVEAYELLPQVGEILAPIILTARTTKQEVRKKVSKDYKHAVKISEGTLTVIPPEKNRFYDVHLSSSLHYFLSLYLFERAASLEYFSTSKKISLIEKFLNDETNPISGVNLSDYQRAIFWIRHTFFQVLQMPSLLSKLRLLRILSSPEVYIDNLTPEEQQQSEDTQRTTRISKIKTIKKQVRIDTNTIARRLIEDIASTSARLFDDQQVQELKAALIFGYKKQTPMLDLLTYFTVQMSNCININRDYIDELYSEDYLDEEAEDEVEEAEDEIAFLTQKKNEMIKFIEDYQDMSLSSTQPLPINEYLLSLMQSSLSANNEDTDSEEINEDSDDEI